MKRVMLSLMILIFVLTLINDEIVTASIFDSVEFCVHKIIPSLYIYMILSEAFVKYNAFENFSRLFNKYLKINMKKSNMISIFILSTICGAPIGAKLSYGAYKNGSLTKKDAIVLNSMTNNISLSFVFGVCSKINESFQVAFAIQILTSLISAFILMRMLKIEEEIIFNSKICDNDFKISDIIKNATYSMINVCASIVVFSFLGDIVVTYFPIKPKYIRGIFEFSSGMMLLDNNDLALMSGFLSFGGLSVHNQIITLWNGELKYKYLLLPKLFQIISSIFFCEMYLLFVDKSIVLL